MQDVSDLYRQILEVTDHEFKTRVDFLLNDNTIYSVFEDALISITVTNQLFSEPNSCIGNACSAECDLEMLLPSVIFPRTGKFEIVVWAEAIIDEELQQSEEIKAGTFFIDTREEIQQGAASVLKIHAYDSMMKGEYEMPPTAGVTYSDALSEICSLLQVSLDDRFPGLTVPGMIPMEVLSDGLTYREALETIAADEHGNWIITEQNTLMLVRIKVQDYETSRLIDQNGNRILVDFDTGLKVGSDYGSYYGDPPSDPPVHVGTHCETFSKAPQIPPVSKVALHVHDGDYEYVRPGMVPTYTMEVNLPGLTSGTIPDGLEEAAERFWKFFMGASGEEPIWYKPYSCTNALLDPAAELGDYVTLPSYYSRIYQKTTYFSGLMLADISAPFAEDHEFVSSAAFEPIPVSGNN